MRVCGWTWCGWWCEWGGRGRAGVRRAGGRAGVWVDVRVGFWKAG